MLIKELLSLLESTYSDEHKMIMDKMSGHMNDLVPEIDFDFTDIDTKIDHYKGYFKWENSQNPKKHGKGTVEFSCGFSGNRVVNINVYDLTGNLQVKIDQSIFAEKED